MRSKSVALSALSALVAALTLCVTQSARAAPTSKLTYVRGPGAEECADEAGLRANVAQRLGYDPFFPWAERTIVAQIDAVPSGFRGQVRIIDARGALLGERTLDTPAKDCAELVKTLALAISIAIDDLDAANVGAPAPTRPPRGVDAAEAPAREEPPDRPPPPVERHERDAAEPPARDLSVRLFATAGAMGIVGGVSSPSLAAIVGGGFSGGSYSAALEGRADVPSSRTLSGGGRITTSLLAVSLVPCVRLGDRTVASFCAVGLVGSFRASAEDVTAPHEDTALQVVLAGRVGVERRLLDWFAAYANIEAGGSLRRHELELNGAVVYAVPALTVGLGLGIRATLR